MRVNTEQLKLKKIMRKNILIISAFILFSACGDRQTQTKNTDASVATEVMSSTQPQSYRLTGTIGEDEATIELEKKGNEVTGVVTRCDFCEPIDIEGTWKGDNIKVNGVSLAGSYIEYELTVEDKAVQGVETLSAEGEVEEQDVKLTYIEE